MKKEVKILGAGISGLTAAINLAKAGFKVIIYEKIFMRLCRYYTIFRSALPTQGIFSRLTKYLTLHIEKIIIALDKKRLKYRGIDPDAQ